MEIVLLAVGAANISFVKEGIAEYMGRLKRYVPFSLKTLPDIRNAGKLSHEQQKEAEGRIILQALEKSDHVALLDERGRQYRSKDFAELLSRRMASGLKRLVFVIGGPYGFSKEVYERADSKISLSEMTFNHEMVRLFFIEQVYRAMTILRGEPYHHE